MKKVTGERAEDHYQRIDPETGEIYQLTPEFCHMSRGGKNGKGIGHGWIKKYMADAYTGDFIIVMGKNGPQKVRVPRFYDKVFEEEQRLDHLLLKGSRKRKAKEHADNNTPERLRVREEVLNARLNLNPRNGV